MSTISCTPVIGLANTVDSQVVQRVTTFNATEAMPVRSKSMFVMVQQYFATLCVDIHRSRAVAQQAFPAVRGN